MKGKITPDLSGDFRETPFPELFSFIFLQKLSGVLKMRKGDLSKEFHFKDGIVVYSFSNSVNELLGQIALSLNMIKNEDIESALSLAREKGIMTGSALLELGKLDRKELPRLLNLQSKMRLINSFNWNEGKFDFYEGENLINDTGIHISPIKVLSTGILKTMEKDRVEARLLSFKDKYPITLSKTPFPLSQIRLEPKYLELLNSLDGKRRLEDVLSFSFIEKERVVAIVYLFHCLGFIEFREGGEDGREADQEDGGGDYLYKHSTGDVSLEGEIPSQTEEEYEEKEEDGLNTDELPIYRSMMDTLDGMKDKNYYEILSVDRKATMDEVIESYYKLSAEYHPDRHYNASPKLKSLLSTIFMKVKEAYDTLSDPQKRKEYDDLVMDGKGKEMEEDVKRIVEAEEKFRMGVRLLQTGNLVSAYNNFSDACSLFGDEPDYHLYRYWVLFRLNFPKNTEKMEEAEREIKKIVEKNPNRGVGYYFLGMIRKAFQDLESARELFVTALKTDPSIVDAERELRAIKKRLFEKMEKESKREKEKEKGSGEGSFVVNLLGGLFKGRSREKRGGDED